MDFDIAVWVAVLVFVFSVWFYMAAEWGFIEEIEASGFVIRTILRTRRVILWASVAPSVQEFTTFLPRFVIRVRDRRFMTMHASFAVLRRNRPIDQLFADELRRRFQLVEVASLRDLWK